MISFAWRVLLVLRAIQISISLSLKSSRSERTVVLLYNKPPNVVTTHATDDSLGRSNVYDEVQKMEGFIDDVFHEDNRRKTQTKSEAKTTAKRRQGFIDRDFTFSQVTGSNLKFHSIGRLDADTTGLLLLTNDGGLVHHVTNKNAGTNAEPITKTYEALVMGRHDENSSMFEVMRNDGVDIGKKYGGLTNPVKNISVLDHPTPKSTLVSLTLGEGKNRQIRRMFHALGSGVMKLKRTHVGEMLTVEGVKEGEWRLLSEQEIQLGLNWKPRQLESSSSHCYQTTRKRKSRMKKKRKKTKRADSL